MARITDTKPDPSVRATLENYPRPDYFTPFLTGLAHLDHLAVLLAMFTMMVI